jgi:hypothetical protein
VPADCCVKQFPLGAGRRPFFCLGKAGFENLQTVEVQILANDGESERINQLCLRMAELQITLHEAWDLRPLLSLVESRKDCLSQFVSVTRRTTVRESVDVVDDFYDIYG